MRSWPPMVTRLPNTSCQRRLPSLCRLCHSMCSCSPATARANSVHRVLLGVGMLAGTERADVEAAGTPRGCSRRRRRPWDWRRRWRRFRCRGRRWHPRRRRRSRGSSPPTPAAPRPRACARRCRSAMASAMESNARLSRPSSSGPFSPLRAARFPAASCSAALHQPRGAPRQQEVKDQPHGERERRHPAGPVERLLDDLRARFGLVPLEVVGQKQAAGARRAQLLARRCPSGCRRSRAVRRRSRRRSSRRGVREWRPPPARRSNCGSTSVDLPAPARRGASRR